MNRLTERLKLCQTFGHGFIVSPNVISFIRSRYVHDVLVSQIPRKFFVCRYHDYMDMISLTKVFSAFGKASILRRYPFSTLAKIPPFLVNALYCSTYLCHKFSTLIRAVPVAGAMKDTHLTGVVRLLMTCLEVGQLPCIRWQPGEDQIVQVGSRACRLPSWCRDRSLCKSAGGV